MEVKECSVMHVHEAVIEAEEDKSGITIHTIDSEYDKGKILFQSTCAVTKNDTADSLAEKIHTLEQEHFPVVVEEYILSL